MFRSLVRCKCYRRFTSLGTLPANIYRLLPNMVCRSCHPYELWRQTDAVCFDFDSTLVTDEFVDELAAFVGKGPEVAAVTKLAMTGAMPFGDALDARLKAIQISKSSLENFIVNKPYQFSEGAEDLIRALQRRNIDIYIISGSFVEAIIPVAKRLDIPTERIFSNGIIFDDNGGYVDFERNRPTAQKGGKRTLVEMLKKKYSYSCLAFVGDGATDLETYDPPHATDVFVGYGGNVSRELIRKNAPIYVESFHQLTAWLEEPYEADNCSCCTSPKSVSKTVSVGNASGSTVM